MEKFWHEDINELETLNEIFLAKYADPEISRDRVAHNVWYRCHQDVSALVVLTNIHLSALRDWIKLSDDAKNLSIGIDPLNSDDGCRLQKGPKTIKNGLRGVASLLHLCYFYAIDQNHGPARAAGLAAGTHIGNLLTKPETIITLSDLLNPVEHTVRAMCPEASEDNINLVVDFSHEISRQYVNRFSPRKSPRSTRSEAFYLHRPEPASTCARSTRWAKSGS
jgi:hypothetical protein